MILRNLTYTLVSQLLKARPGTIFLKLPNFTATFETVTVLSCYLDICNDT